MRGRIWLCSFFYLVASPSLQAEQDTVRHQRSPHLSVGFQLDTFSDDFGMGISLTSPFMARQGLAIRVRGDILWHPAVPPGGTEQEWIMYASARLGLLGVAGFVTPCIRLYGEGGVLAIFPVNDDLRDGVAFGGYGVFGFEFFSGDDSPVSFFIELGGAGSGASADKLADKPSLANGFLVNVGLHWYPY